MKNNVINFNDIKNIKKPTELTVIDDKSQELSISKHKTTALAIKKQVWNVINFETKKQEILSKKSHYDIEFELAKIFKNTIEEVKFLLKDHEADDYKEQKAA